MTVDSTAAPISAQSPPATPPYDSSPLLAPGSSPAPPATSAALESGFENVSADERGGTIAIGYENRRYRHSADALGVLRDDLHGAPFVAFERRLGLAAAAIEVRGAGDSATFSVRYPSDPDFPAPPRGPMRERTFRSVDLLVQPVIGYELGRLTAPIQFRVQIEPMVSWNPWPGALAVGSVLIPVYNTFDFSSNHPDIENFRPGRAMLEQFAWIPRIALASGSVGLFGDNRYGGSVGAARPLAGGRLLLDAQFDLTGFVAFETGGISYSPAKQWDSFGGLTWNMPWFDSAVRLRGGQFLYGDRGFHGEFRREFGDFEYGLFYIRSGHLRIEGIRVVLPIPPLTRPTQSAVRVLPVERFPISYRTDATPVGEFVTGVASREDYLRQLNPSALEANRYRYERRGSRVPRSADVGPVEWMNSSGTSGFIFTPWANSLSDGTISLDYTHVPAKWSYSGRPEFVNQAYSMTIGLLPRVEASLRFTRLPGAQGPFPDIDNRITTDTDHMASGRLVLLTPAPMRPGLAVGVEDISGTRRFHSTYAVAGIPFEINHVQNRFSFGYAPRVFTATRYVLDGGFGAIEVSPWRAVATRLEYDSEKWNVGIGVALPYGLRFRASALNLETLSVGGGWTHGL